MPDALFSYHGCVPPDGFAWIAARPTAEPVGKEPQPFLVAARPEEGASGERAYELSDLDVVAYRSFAETQLDQESLLAFANKFGALGLAVPITFNPENARDHEAELQGESLQEWQRQISVMAELVALWDLYRAGDREGLARHFRRGDETQRDVVTFFSHADAEGETGRSTLGHLDTRERVLFDEALLEVHRRTEPGDELFPALVSLKQRLDEQLQKCEKRAAPFLTWASRDRLALRFSVCTLASALWLQFADAVANNRSYTRCEVCKRWFELAPDTARSHKRFCSDACRVAAYRDRQDRARRLYFDQKKTFEQIAKELGSRVVTVRRWITGR